MPIPATPAPAIAVAQTPALGSPPAAQDLTRLVGLTLVPQAIAWAVVMAASMESLGRLSGGERLTRSSLGFLAGFGAPAEAAATAAAAVIFAALLAALPGPARWRARAIQALGLGFTVALVAWSQAVLVCIPFLAQIHDQLAASGALAWVVVPLVLAALLLAGLSVLGDDAGRPFPTGEFAHTFVLVCAIALPYLTLETDFKLPIDLAVVWTGTLAACFAGLLSGLVLESAWRRLPDPHVRFGPWFILAVSSVATLAVIRRVEYVSSLLG